MSAARVRIVGRSAAERSAIARAMHRAGFAVEELERASDLTAHLLRSTDIVIALDQHIYLTRLLRDAQSDGAAPLLLPIGVQTSARDVSSHTDASIVDSASNPAPSAASRAKDVPSGAEDVRAGAVPSAGSMIATRSTRNALQPWLERAQALLSPPDADDLRTVRAHYDALADHVRQLTEGGFDDAEMGADSDADDAERTIAVQDLYDVMPEHDPRNQDAGPLPELDTPRSTGWVAVFAGIVALVAAAYLILAPPTEREREEERLRQEVAAENAGTERAAHVVYRARAVAARSPLEIQAEPAQCRRLVQEGRLELARQVCGRAYRHDASSATPLARVLMQSHAANEALELLEAHVKQRPDDLEAWALLANAARNTGRADIEANALEQLIELHRRSDPIAPLQERLDVLHSEPAPAPPASADDAP